jgi:endonuclease G
MARLQDIMKGEDKLVKEVKEIIKAGGNLTAAIKAGIKPAMVKAVISNPANPESLAVAEAVVVPYMRPVLFVKGGKIEIPESEQLKERLFKYKPRIEPALKSVGRVELVNHQLKYAGTGWMIEENIMITNRHVANVFADKNKTGFGGSFKTNFLGVPIGAKIDFKEEYNPGKPNTSQFEVQIEKIIYLPDEDPRFPDMAILKLKKTAGIPTPITFQDGKLKLHQDIGVVGYPAKDPRGVDSEEMEKRIFGEVFGVKRYAPGQIIQVPGKHWYFAHDASTLGGNSGSLVQDMETGHAIGLHFSGVLLDANYAVKGNVILDIASKKLKLTGIKKVKAGAVAKAVKEAPFVQESVESVGSYANREGFKSNFLGTGSNKRVPLPTIKNKSDVLKFGPANKDSILKYTHFSVVMSEKRRLCYFSAVNIDGAQYQRMKRPGWRLDPRIPVGAQIMKECYGNAPKFSRGHMTRREDPNWGPLAAQGNADSMHVTNAVPQMQSFNAPVWLSLENYALENAKHDDQKISVLTGPFFTKNDPVKYEVQIPTGFWKVIAFIHDDTGKLCATGYTISQEDYLQNEEFIYGEFETYQIPIQVIEKRAGISFGSLKNVDPMNDESLEAISVPVNSVRQIKFY